MIVDRINAYLSSNEVTLDQALRYEVEKLAGVAFSRQFMTEKEDRPNKLYASSAGKCARQVAYQFHGFERAGKEIDSRAKIVFWTGDLAELTVVALAKLAGCQITATGLNQIRATIPLGAAEIVCKPDGLVLNGSLHLLEVKSMSSYSYERFEDGYIDPSYEAQVQIGMKALSVQSCVFIALNKESGVLNERKILFDEAVYKRAIENVQKVLDSTKENLPARPFEPDAKGFLPWNCLYCAYWKHCWPLAEKVLVRNAYKLKHPTSAEVAKQDAWLTEVQGEKE